ncbi:hypothetical protein BD311DRAFT_751546 [Dichomitus squalens]|uniref:Uncharacterized protein n=1 Tax=Dichomitus squalens TaxID=114155 RepID=A0A4Q9MZH8_9APHY|nr:hypothetical protein BD311DRAFT_751546 [Dichomitus squalens]
MEIPGGLTESRWRMSRRAYGAEEVHGVRFLHSAKGSGACLLHHSVVYRQIQHIFATKHVTYVHCKRTNPCSCAGCQL